MFSAIGGPIVLFLFVTPVLVRHNPPPRPSYLLLLCDELGARAVL